MNDVNTGMKAQASGLRIDFLPISHAMFNKTAAYDACTALYADPLGCVPYKTLQPIVERTDMNPVLEKWIFSRSCQAARDMMAENAEFDYISVNMSASYMRSDTYIRDLLEILEEAEVPAGKLCIEVTESAMKADADALVNRLHELRREGFKVAVDDYSASYMPLSRLDGVPADVIKLDRMITNNTLVDSKAEHAVKSIHRRAKELGCELVAKSVEDQKHKYLLIALGCERIQGGGCSHEALQ